MSSRNRNSGLNSSNSTQEFCSADYRDRPLSSLPYLNILIGILVFLACLTMLFVTIEAPPIVLKILDTKRFGFLFTFRGRYLIDLVVSLFLFGMGVFGIVMGAITLALIFGIRFIGVKNPESFSELFRQPLNLDDDDETFVTYDGATLESAEQT